MGLDQSGKVYHRHRNFSAKEVEQIGWEVMFKGHPCEECGSPRTCLRIQSFCAFSDMTPTNREAAKLLVKSGQWESVMLVTGPGVRVGETYACLACASMAECQAADLPSYIVCTFDRNYKSEGPTVSVLG